MQESPFSLYLHFPYCSHRCPYCDFNVHVRKELPESEFIAALLSEAKYRAMLPEWQSRAISTIFMGGGTPSLFSAESLAKLLSGLKKLWHFETQVEITLEANPDTISYENLKLLKSIGINRLSIGAQSLSDNFLKILGRNHNSRQIKEAVYSAKQAGFANINIDLMFSLPYQTLNDLQLDIQSALELDTQHISYYSLTIEPGTPFYERQLSGSLNFPSNDLAAAMMEKIILKFAEHGLSQYEISNFAKNSYECRHNQAYWETKDYLGLGPGSHSAISRYCNNKRLETKRWSNKSMPEAYIDKPTNSVAWSETILGGNLIFESILLGLRQIKGIEISHLEGNLEENQRNNFWKLINELCNEGFLSLDSNQNKKIALSKEGLMIADSIIEKFSPILLSNK